ncbi:MAG: lysophospholipid acyltransferase family protein, partial [Alphaproteobacteria bacterium]
MTDTTANSNVGSNSASGVSEETLPKSSLGYIKGDLARLELPPPVYENAGQVGSRLLLAWRIFLFILLVLPTMAVQLVLMGIGSPKAKRFPRWFHKRLLKLIGVDVVKRGRPSKQGPTLFVSNHISYLDIPILGSLVDGSFVAKAEISKWPFFGWLAKMQYSLFIDREPKNAAKHAEALKQRLEQSENLFLFPEGTTCSGVRVETFKSSLFSVAQIKPNGNPVLVQPVSIAYTHLDGMRMGRNFRYFFAWFGTQDLAPHLAEALMLGKLKVIVEFHPVVTIEEFGRRQALAKHCYEQI